MKTEEHGIPQFDCNLNKENILNWVNDQLRLWGRKRRCVNCKKYNPSRYGYFDGGAVPFCNFLKMSFAHVNRRANIEVSPENYYCSEFEAMK